MVKVSGETGSDNTPFFVYPRLHIMQGLRECLIETKTPGLHWETEDSIIETALNSTFAMVTNVQLPCAIKFQYTRDLTQTFTCSLFKNVWLAELTTPLVSTYLSWHSTLDRTTLHFHKPSVYCNLLHKSALSIRDKRIHIHQLKLWLTKKTKHVWRCQSREQWHSRRRLDTNVCCWWRIDKKQNVPSMSELVIFSE